MSKLKSKFLEDYSINTLRDVNTASLTDESNLIWDAQTSRWTTPPRVQFGRDFAEKSNNSLQRNNSQTPLLYDSLTFTVNNNTSNKYRMACHVIWALDIASRDFIGELRLDGVVIKYIQIEPKDPGTDQRVDSSLVHYVSNLSQGSHTLSFYHTYSGGNNTSAVFSGVLEAWRVS